MRDDASEQVRRTSGASYLTIRNQISDRKPHKQRSQADGAWGSHCQPEAVPHLLLPAVVHAASTASTHHRDWQREDHLNDVMTRWQARRTRPHVREEGAAEPKTCQRQGGQRQLFSPPGPPWCCQVCSYDASAASYSCLKVVRCSQAVSAAAAVMKGPSAVLIKY
jgi:hypothetical protein